MRPPKNDRARHSRRRGFDDDQFYGNTLPPPSFQEFGATSSVPQMRATVKWYNPEKGFGFVELTDGSGDVFLHASALQAAGHQVVSPGATLGVRVGRGPKGRQVDQVLSVDENTAGQPQPSNYAQGSRPRMQRPARTEVNLASSVEMTGTVKWYNPDKGFGFIAPENGGRDVFLHATAIERAGMAPPQEGQIVRMNVVQGAKGPEVGSISPG